MTWDADRCCPSMEIVVESLGRPDEGGTDDATGTAGPRSRRGPDPSARAGETDAQ